jgi:hypothetical protein
MSAERIVASAHAVFSTAIARVRARALQTRICGHDALWQAWVKVASAAAVTSCAALAHAADNAKHVTSAPSHCVQALPGALHLSPLRCGTDATRFFGRTWWNTATSALAGGRSALLNSWCGWRKCVCWHCYTGLHPGRHPGLHRGRRAAQQLLRLLTCARLSRCFSSAA